jgi:hypothetical protein
MLLFVMNQRTFYVDLLKGMFQRRAEQGSASA